MFTGYHWQRHFLLGLTDKETFYWVSLKQRLFTVSHWNRDSLLGLTETETFLLGLTDKETFYWVSLIKRLFTGSLWQRDFLLSLTETEAFYCVSLKQRLLTGSHWNRDFFTGSNWQRDFLLGLTETGETHHGWFQCTEMAESVTLPAMSDNSVPWEINSSKLCPTPALQPLFVPTGWLHFSLDTVSISDSSMVHTHFHERRFGCTLSTAIMNEALSLMTTAHTRELSLTALLIWQWWQNHGCYIDAHFDLGKQLAFIWLISITSLPLKGNMQSRETRITEASVFIFFKYFKII